MNGERLDPRTLGLPVRMAQEVRHVITFRAVGSKTELTVKEFGYMTEQVVEISRVGLGQCIDNMNESMNK
jgi:hypothetical protein